MTRKLTSFKKEYEEFSTCILKGGWYSQSTETALGKLFDEATGWDDTLDFMDTLIDHFEREPVTEEVIVIQARFALPDSLSLETAAPQLDQARQQAGAGAICAFPFRIATILNRWPFYQCPVWHHDPRYHSMKLFTYYRCANIPSDEAHPCPGAGPYQREIVRFYSQNWTQGNSPGFLLP